MKQSKKLLIALVAFASFAARQADAHFIWLLPETSKSGETKLQVFFAEEAISDDPELLKRLDGLKVVRVNGSSTSAPLELTLDSDSLWSKLNASDANAVYIAKHDLGVMDRGTGVFRLQYYAKTGPAAGDSAWSSVDTSESLKLDVTPSYSGDEVGVLVRFDGKPVARAEVKVEGVGLKSYAADTNAEGKVSFKAEPGEVYSIRARHIEKGEGELNGKKYPETRHYSTLALRTPGEAKTSEKKEVAVKSDDRYPVMPRPVTSMGAAIVDGYLYVYGGHAGGAHSYSAEEQEGQLHRLSLTRGSWETVADGPKLTGLSMIAHKGKLYRIGGFTVKNKKGEENDLYSQDSFVAFDPKTGQWEEDLPSLPEPRSSHDSAIVGDTLYVVGGWNMQGEDDDSHWHTTAWSIDLSSDSPKWTPVPTPPFQRRALSVGAHDGKLYAIGGMQEGEGPTRRTDVLDLKSGKWTQGPDLVGDEGMVGFGASVQSHGGHLYISTIDGSLQKLSDDGSKWEVAKKMPTARFFHRMLPFDKSSFLVVGGANMSVGKFASVEIVRIQ